MKTTNLEALQMGRIGETTYTPSQQQIRKKKVS